MAEYEVGWAIEVEADCGEDAIRLAWAALDDAVRLGQGATVLSVRLVQRPHRKQFFDMENPEQLGCA